MAARQNSPMAKFMASVAEETFQVLMGEVKSRGISVQELLRAVIIPDWGARSQDGKYDHNLTDSRAAGACIQRREGRTP